MVAFPSECFGNDFAPRENISKEVKKYETINLDKRRIRGVA